MTIINSCSNEHAVSEAIGFLLIFTIVIVGIGMVTLYGYPILIEQQVNADEKIMEKNMIVLQNDVKSLAYKTVPFKETSLKIGGGALTVYSTSSTPAVSTIDITDCAGTQYVSAFQSGDLRYSSEKAGTDISLQNGAVVMREHAQTGSVMLAEPRWFYDARTNTMVINLIGFNSTDIMSRTGIGTVQMAMGETNYTYVSPPGNAQFCVVYNTPDSEQDYSVAWDNYFQNTLKMGPPVIAGTTRTYTLPPKSPDPINGVPSPVLVIKKYDVIVKSL